MRAVFIKEFGGTENLEIREVPDPPSPQRGEVLVNVKAAGLNRADLLQRRGLYRAPEGYPQQIPGMEFSGVVAEAGEAVAFEPGTRVFGIIAGGAQAEKILIDHRHIAAVPDELDLIEAGGIPEVFITAYDAVFSQAKLAACETLLVHAVGSGVGLAALQLAAAHGNRVIGTSRTAEKLERCREFGLVDAIVPDDGNFADAVLRMTQGRGVDVILDLVGGKYFTDNLKSLAHRGRIMTVGLTAGRRSEIDLGALLSKRASVIGTTLRGRDADEKAEAVAAFSAHVVPLFAAGKLSAGIDRVFPLGEIREAHEYLESNESFGKVVIEIAE
jgi:putative PIG3 family NAD(P)H quinone oxidoreductase